MSYRPELGVSQVLNPKVSQEYQQFFEITRWIIELGWDDILYEVSLISNNQVMPQKGHMEALMLIFVYLGKAYQKTIIVDLMIPKFDNPMEIVTNWLKSIYGKDNQEEIQTNTP